MLQATRRGRCAAYAGWQRSVQPDAGLRGGRVGRRGLRCRCGLLTRPVAPACLTLSPVGTGSDAAGMSSFLVRFVVAGLVVAATPEVARLFGNRIAGYLPLLPVIAIAGFLALHQSEGMRAVREAAAGTLPALIPYAMFCIGVIFLAGRGWQLAPTISLSVVFWAAGLGPVHLITR